MQAGSIAALTGKIETLLTSPGLLVEMRKNARRLGYPRAAFTVARQVVELARGCFKAATNKDSALAAATVPVLMNQEVAPWGQITHESAPDVAIAA